jgi:hypothetical protein
MERARDAITASSGLDRGDELRRWAEALAYRAALDYEAALRDIETRLAQAALSGWSASDQVHEHGLDIIRRHMLRGLYRAQVEAGESVVFWRLR